MKDKIYTIEKDVLASIKSDYEDKILQAKHELRINKSQINTLTTRQKVLKKIIWINNDIINKLPKIVKT